jgi:hypothetical protein
MLHRLRNYPALELATSQIEELFCSETGVLHRLRNYPALELAYFTD